MTVYSTSLSSNHATGQRKSLGLARPFAPVDVCIYVGHIVIVRV